MRASLTPQHKVYNTYVTEIENDQLSIIREPEAVYASAFNDLITVANYDKDYAAGLLDVSYKTVSRYQK